ncbi:MAG: thiamine-phosphate kinase [Thermoleophilia bacterium]|nr:thiamine-phosphate kinase [Thermoleophilia bacterium]
MPGLFPSGFLPFAMREQALLEHIERATPRHPLVAVGPGDDCAVLMRPEGALLITTDQVIAGRHFAEGEDLTLVARKAVARSLSDIAAMAGRPLWAVATGALPAGMAQDDAQDLTDALHQAAAGFGIPIVGGDLATTAGPMVLTVTVGGEPHPVRGPVLRSGAAPGDTVYVTGALGGSLASGRHLTFTPRVTEGAWLATVLGPWLHAMMDLSDGLGLDAARMARASGVAIEIEAERLPRHAGVTSWQGAAGDGEDYELLFTAPAGAPVPARCRLTGTPVTAVGRVLASGEGGVGDARAATSCAIIDGAGARHGGAALGWEHRS